MPDPIPLRPRRDDAAADVRSLVQLGEAPPQPVPAPSTSPFLEPVYDPPLEPLPDDPA
ncbi:hypothetical protein [Streptomyces sp. NPDC047706]|uniref:hypothetical protein n=1 Tax=Streptomyces sp. NPDC047706 TaxID=3365486 RepID=UPI00371CF663